jgi:hypothetical protein
MVIANKRVTCFDRSLFVNCDDSIRACKICQPWSDTRTDARDVSLSGRPSERDRTQRLDGDNLYSGKFLAKALRHAAESSGRPGADKDPVDSFELECNLGGGLFGVDILVRNIGVLI